MMTKKVYFIRKDADLDTVLSAFQRHNCYFLIIINKKRETVGIVTISDLFEKFFGRKFVDGFDSDDNAITVSERPNNSTKNGENL
jgi:CBS domain containing-hemolysin-like protein